MKVSIITPSFNAAEYIEETLRSVADQTYHDVEHIIIDGGSNDGTLDIVMRFVTGKTMVISEADMGMYDAINKGLRKLSGDIVLILNADDVLSDRWVIERVVKKVSKLCSWEKCCYVGDVSMAYEDSTHSLRRAIRTNAEELVAFGNCTYIPLPSLFVPKALYAQAGEYSLEYKYASDYDMVIRLLLLGSVSRLGFVTTIFRRHAGAITTKFALRMTLESAEIKNRFVTEMQLSTLARLGSFVFGVVKYLLINPVVIVNALRNRFL